MTDRKSHAQYALMQRLCACVAIVSALAGGCSAAGVPIGEPENVTPLSTDLEQAQLEAIAWSIRDVVDVAVKSLLRAPPGAVMQQLTSTGTLTIQGTAEQPNDAAERLTLILAFGAYRMTLGDAPTYPDWQLYSAVPANSASPKLTLDFTNEPLAASDANGSIDGTFAGAVGLAHGLGYETVDARLAVHGALTRDAGGNVTWQSLHVSGVIFSPTDNIHYYSDASIPNP